MITRIEVRNFRCLKVIKQSLEPFQILIGPNASGKTTFLDTIAFLRALTEGGAQEALASHIGSYGDLTWRGNGEPISIAIDLRIPEFHVKKLRRHSQAHNTVRYKVEFGQNAGGVMGVGILRETLSLEYRKQSGETQSSTAKPYKVISRQPGGRVHYFSEFMGAHKGSTSYYLRWDLSALQQMVEDEHLFPVAVWLKRLLSQGVQPMMLNSLKLRQASPPSQSSGFNLDGSNLPWVIERLKQTAPERFDRWVAHLRTALPDLKTVRTTERPEDRHRYLVLSYDNGFEPPSWLVSDGTLRLLALTLPAYLPDQQGIYLIEEPENGIHPRALETIYESLSSVYDAQVLVASHSPVLLSIAEPKQLLCFSKTPEGATQIVSGDHHPALKKWRGEIGLGMFFAAGVLE